MGKTFEVLNPATEQVIAEVAEAGDADVNFAVKAARKAFDEGAWKETTPRQRAKYLLKIAALLEKHKEEFARIESIDNGKPISETMNADLPLAIQCFEYYASLADKLTGETIPVEGNGNQLEL